MKNKTKPICVFTNYLKPTLFICLLLMTAFTKPFAQTVVASSDVSSAVSAQDAQIKALKAKLAILRKDMADTKAKSVSPDSTVILTDDAIAKNKLAKDEKIKSLSLQIADVKSQLRKLGAPEPDLVDDSTLSGDVINNVPSISPTNK